jgi:glycosyltransferase involved in cell wall biosynthesis
MRVLCYLNVSNLENLSADSGYQFLDSLLAGLADHGVQAVVATNPAIEFSTASTLPIQPGRTKYEVRFEPPVAQLRKLVGTEPFDLVFLNQIELGATFRTLLDGCGRGNVPLVSYCHYIPVQGINGSVVRWDPSLNDEGKAPLVLERILDGVEASDLVLIQSRYAADLLRQSAKAVGKSISTTSLMVLPPPANRSEIRMPIARQDSPLTLFYNHRLYGHYGTHRFIDWLERMPADLQKRVECWVSDPLGPRSAERRALDPSPDLAVERLRRLRGVRYFHPTSRDGYLALLSQAQLGFLPFREGLVWSMSAVDLMQRGIPVIGPRMGAVPEILPASLVFDDEQEAYALVERMVDQANWREQQGHACRHHTARLGVDQVAAQLHHWFKGLHQAGWRVAAS